MKKISVTFLVALFISSAANAKDGLYAGADLLRARVQHKYLVLSPDLDLGAPVGVGSLTHANSYGFGLNVGYKIGFDKIFIAPEIFYDYLNNKAPDFFADSDPVSAQDSLSINYRYGAKLNLGYNIMSKFNVFVNAGLTNVDYDVRWPSTSKSHGASKIAMIYGAGLSYNIDENLAVRGSYDHQKFNIQYVDEGRRSEVSMNVYKIGMIYGF